jgi:hypothetical protein
MSAPREWTDDQLRALFPALAVEAQDPVRCPAAGAGQGAFISDRRGCARIDITVEPAGALAVSFEHEWPSEREPAWRVELDARILAGSCDALAHGRAGVDFGRIVTRSVVDYGVESTPPAFAIAASMALLDAIRRGGWDPEPPTHDRMATFGRLAG